MSNFTLTASTDTFTGTAGQLNTFFFVPANLQPTDTITGGATGGFIDVLSVTAGGAITAPQFAGVTNIEELHLSASGNSVALTNGLVAGTSNGNFSVIEAGGDNVVDASGISNNIGILIQAASGNDTLSGGSGDDIFFFAPSGLNGADTITGGGGFDIVFLNAAGGLGPAALSNVSNVEALVLGGAGNTATLTNNLLATSGNGQFTVTSLGGDNVVDASGVGIPRTIIFNAGTGVDSFTGGVGNDSFVFAPANLTSADTVIGGPGIDSVLLLGGGTVAASSFQNFSGLEALVLSAAGNNVALSNPLVGNSTIGAFAVASQGGTNTVDASAVTLNVPIIMVAASGSDTFRGGASTDAFVFAAADLTSVDTVQGGGGTDALYLTTGGLLAAGAFTNVSNVETLILTGGDINVTLNNASVASSGIGAFFVVDNAANSSIDASGIVSTTVSFSAAAGNDAFRGGGGNDVFSFAAADLNSADIVIGGAGADALTITTNGTVSLANNSGISQIEAVQLAAGGEFDFANTLSTTSLIAVGSAAVDKFDGTAVTNYALTIIGNGGADTLIGGSQDDTVIIPDGNFASIDGRAGNDTVAIAGSQTFDVSASASKMHNVEVISLDNTPATAVALSVTGADVTSITPGNTLYVVGGVNDQIRIGDGFTLTGSGIVNTSIASTIGYTFDHYHNLNGSDLYVASNIILGPTIPEGGHAPVASPVTLAAIAEDSGARTITAAELLVGVSDPDGQPTAITSLTIQSGLGTLTQLNATTWSYTPALNDATGVTFAYTASDGSLTSSSTASLDITPVNDAPVASAVTLTAIAEDSGARTITAAELLAGVTDVDGPTPTITSLTIQSGLGSLTQLNATTWSYTPASNDATGVTFAYTASDGSLTSSSTASLDITPVNDAPVATPVTLAAIAEDSGARTITAAELLAGVTDVDGPGPFITTVTIQSGLGSLTQVNGTTWSYTPALNDAAAVIFGYSASDFSLSSSSTASLDITPVNDAPVASPVTLAAIAEDSGAHTITAAQLLTGVTDVDGPTPTITSLTIQSGLGSLTQLNATTWSYTPASNDATGVTFAYTASDGSLTSSSTALLDITPVNDAPVASPVTLTAIAEDSGARTITAAELLAGVTDVDGPTPTITSLTIQSGLGSLTQLNATTWSYTPAGNDDTGVTFAYTASDGSLSSSSTASLDITPVNDAPVASPVTLTAIAEDSGARTITAAELLAGVTDVDGPGPFITTVTIQSGLGSLTQVNGTTWSYTPALNDAAAVIFGYSASDFSLSSSSTASLDITPVNDAPVASPVTLTAIAEDSGARTITAAELLAGVTDVDGPTPTITSLTIQSGLGSLIQLDATTWSYTPAGNDDTGVTFAYTASDGSLTSSSTASLDITPVNDAPVATPVTLTAIAEDSGARTITAAELLAGVTDVDGPTPTITSLTIQSGLGSLIQLDATTWSYTPAGNDDTGVTFAYTASDGSLTSSSTASLDITPVNDAPVATPVTLTAIAEDSGARTITAAELLAGVTDVDGPTPTITSLTIQSGLGSLIQLDATTWSYTPASNDDTGVTFNYTASDGSLTSSSTASLDITPVNDGPVASPVTLTAIAEDSGVRVITSAELLAGVTDVDGPTPTITSLTIQSGLGSLIQLNATTWSYTPASNDDTGVTFAYTASDGSLTSSSTASLDITPVNDAPAGTAPGAVTATEDLSFAFTGVNAVSVADVDGNVTVTLSVDHGVLNATGAGVTGNGTGTLIIASDTPTAVNAILSTLQYQGLANFNGSDTLTMVTSDGSLSDTDTVSITVNAVNDNPVAVGDSTSTNEDNSVTYNVLVNDSDVDGDSLSVTSAVVQGGATFGTAVINADKTITFTPAANSNGPVVINYTIADGQGGTASSTLSITVNSVNDAPVGVADSFTTNEDTSLTGLTSMSVLANDADVEDGAPVAVARINGTAIAINGTVGVSGGSVSLNADQTLTFQPNPDLNGDVSFSYTAKDSSGVESAPTTVAIHINAVNDAPVAAPNFFTTAEDTAITFNPLANDSDAESGKPNLISKVAGQAIVVGGTVAVTGGVVKLNADQTLTFTPNADYNTTGVMPNPFFTYVAKDVIGGLESNAANVSYTVTAVNDAPVNTVPASVTATEDTPQPIAVSVADIDSNVTVTLSVAHGVLNVTGAGVSGSGGNTVTIASTTPAAMNTILTSLTYQGATNFNGADTLTVVTSDGSLSDTDTVAITVNPVNDNPVVDLNGAPAGIDRNSDPYTSGATAINVATAVATVTDIDNAISKITLHLTADTGTTDGMGTEGLTLPPGASAYLTSIGFTVSGEGSDNLEIMANDPGGVSPSVFEGILKTVLYHDNDTTFSFNPEDRSIAVTATDAAGGVSSAAHVHIDLAANVTDVNGPGALNHFTGANLADTVRGNDGNDTMEGRGGDDIIWGGTEGGDSGHDTAVFTGNQADYTVTRTGPGVYTVADSVANRDGTDTVHGVETLHFNGDPSDLVLDAPVLVFNASGNVLLASFQAGELDLAVNYANSHAGANIIELQSASGPFTAGTWPVDITEAVTIKAVGGTATVNAGSHSGFTIQPGAVSGAGDVVHFEGLSITGDGIAPDTVGVLFNGSYEGMSDGAIELVATSASGFGQDGVAIIGGGSGLTVTIDGDDPGVGGTQTATFTASGHNASSGGSGDLLFFNFTGSAALKNLSVIGTTGTVAGAADNGIQFAGFDGTDHSVDHAIGTVTFDQVTVSGTYEKTLVYVQGYDNYNGLSFANGLTLGGAGSQTSWTGLFIDGGPQGGAYVAGGTSTLNLTGVTVNGGTYGTSPSFAALGSKPIVVNGVVTGDIITGTNAAEAFIGSTGDDTINAGGGSDLVVYDTGDGHDTVDGEGGTDTLALINFTAGAPSATSATFTVAQSAGHLIVNTDGSAPAEVDALGMESLQVQLGNGGDTVTLTGNLAGAGISTGAGGIIIAGGTGSDTLDASALTSANAITFSNLGGGNDTFKAANVVANDVVNGAGGTGDTADYSVATQAVTIDLTAGTAVGASVGNDDIQNFENAMGGAGNDTLHGTNGANAFTGNGGVDTVTYAGLITAGMITTNGSGGWTVTSGSEGTDTLSTVEAVQGLNPAGTPTGKFLLVGNGGYASLEDAVAAALDGDTILLGTGTIALETTPNDGKVTIDKDITIIGRGAGFTTLLAATPIANAQSSSTAAMITVANGHTVNFSSFTVDGNDRMAGGVDVSTGILFDGGDGSITNMRFTNIGADVGDEPRGTGVVAWDGAQVTVTGSDFDQNERRGLAAFDTGTLVTITGSHFTAKTGQDEVGSFPGTLDYGVQVSDGAVVDISGSTFDNFSASENGFGSAGVLVAPVTGGSSTLNLNAGNTFTDNSSAVAVGFNPTDTDTVNFNNPVTVNSTVPGALGLQAFGDVVVTGVPANLTGDAVAVNWIGGPNANLMDGDDQSDFLQGNGDADTISGHGGDDTIVWNAGDGDDTIDGGNNGAPHSDTDTLQVAANGHNLTLTAGAGNFTITDGTSTATVSEVEEVNITLSGGETVTINGDFTGTGVNVNTFTIDGSAGSLGETVDARNLSSAHEVVFTGGSGDDTFYSGHGNDTFHGNAGNDIVNYTVEAGIDVLDGGGNSDTLNVFGTAGNDTIHVSINGSQAITSIEGMSPTSIEVHTADGLGGSGDTLDYSGSGANAVAVNLQTGSATGFATIANVENAIGTSGDDTFTGDANVNTFTGGAGSDVYNVLANDVVVEQPGGGTADEVRTTDSYTLGNEVENLTLQDKTGTHLTDTQIFDNMGLGPITDGEDGWTVNGPNAPRDQAVVDLGGGNYAFHMSSDPSVADFAGPFSPQLSAAAGEQATGAAFNGQSISFDFKAVNSTPDNSRLEIDFGNVAGTDRNNFMVIESIAGQGIRIAVNEPKLDGNFTTNDFTAFSGNITLASGVDASQSHHLELRLSYVDGQDNDIINVYLDGQYIGKTTTFENYHDALGGTHNANATANLTDRVFFRPSANGATQDGSGTGQNQGFNFDNLTTSVYNNTSGTGNGLANVIAGNSGDNLLTGLGGDDTLNGGLGIDTAAYQDVRSNYAISASTDSHGRVTGFSQVQETGPSGLVAEGTDALSGIERLQFADATLDLTQKVQLFHGGNLVGTFNTIQAAINTGVDGDTISLAAGTYNEAVNLNKDVTILGANSGTSGTSGGRGAESVLTGGVHITAAGVTIDGVKIDGNGNFAPDVTDPAAVYISANAATITNSVLQGDDNLDGYGVITNGGLTGLQITDNQFSGYGVATYIVAGTAGSITGNLFDDTNGNAVNTESQSTIVTGNTIEQTIGGEIQVLSADQTVDASAFVYGNTYTGLHAHPVQIYPNYTGGAAVITGTELGDTLNGDLVFPASPGPFTFHGLGGNDSAYGSALGDTFDGGAGNDDLEGNNGKDTANYDDVVSNYMVVTHSDANGFVDGFVSVAETAVNTGAIDEGTDTLSGIEVLQFSGTTFDLTKAVQVFHGGNLVGTFDVIQDGVNAAVAGDTVLINGAIDSSFNESVTVSAGITLKGIGSVTINGGASSALTIANGGAVQSLVIDNIDLVANSSGTPNHVVSVANTAQYASVTLKNGNVSGGAYAGFFLNNATGVAGVTIQNAQFSGAALVNSGSSGESEIYFYHYNGNVTLSGVSVTNPGLTGLEYGIQMVGQSPAAPMGTVSFSNVTVNGTYVKAGVAADTFSSANLSFLDPDAGGPLSGLTVNVSAGFAGINFDNIGGTIDLSGQPVSATNSNPSPTAFDIDLQGTSGSENFHGTNNDNFFNGKAGADILTGGSGNDVFFHVIGDGADTISGGGQTTADVLLVAGQGGFTGPLSGASETVSVQLNGLSQITSIDTASVAGVELVALDMGGGTDTLDYTGNSVAVTVNLAAGTAPGFSNIAPAVPTAIAGVENVIGGSNADTLTGSSVANALSGGGGNDTMTGGAGSDTLYGGTDGADSGNADIGVFAGNLSAYHVAFDPFAAPGVAGIDATVDDGAGNVDATHGVELLQFDNTTLDLTKNVLLYTGNDLIGTFDTIQAAVTAAHASGDTIKLKALTYSENVTITSKQLTIDGVDDSGPSATTIAGQITVDGTLNGALIVKDVKIDATGQQYGVFVSANSPMNTGSLTLDNVTIQNAAQDGLAYVRTGNGTTPTLTDTIGAVTIQHSEFSNNASNTTGGGRGDILLFGFNGNLTIDDVSIHDPAAGAQKAIQMRGSQDGSDITNVGPFDPAGNVAINDLTITGAYGQDAMAFYRLASFASFTGTGNNVNVTRSPTANTNAGLEPWAVINFDEVGGTINLAGFFVSASNLASPDGIVPAVPSVIATPQGLSTPDNFTGTSGMDVLDGRGGADTIHAGAGDDTITYTAGSGPDTLIDGGADSDTLAIGGTAANDTITVVLNGANQIVSLDTGTVTSVESATINLAGGAGDTLSYAGTSVGVTVNLSGTQSAAGFTTAAGIENVTGGAGIDTLTGSSGNNVINGGGGNDIIVGGLGDDTLSGGTGDDTFTYTVGDGIDTVDGGAGVEVDGDEQIVNGTGATETFNINPISSGYLGINIHAGASDAATDANYEVRTIDVEEIVINTNGGGDSVIISGDLGSTGVATSTITVNGDAGNNTLNASGVTGPSPVGVAFHGNGGDDTLFGGAGDDILDGGADNDTAVIGGSAGASTVTYTTDGNGFVTGFSQVTGPGGTDTLTDIEHLAFDNGYPNNPAAWTTLDPTKAVQLYDHSGQLIGTFDHIQQAVGAADGSGETIKIRNGIYTEQVHVGAGKDGLHIVGQSEAGVIVKAPAGMQSFANDANSPFGLRPLFSIVTVNGSLNVNIENLSINGDEQGNQSQIGIGIGGVAGDFDGIAYVNASGTVDHVTIDKIRDPLVNATTLSGTQRGNDLVVSNTIGAPHDFTLSNSTLEGFQKTGAVIRNAHVTLDNNDVIGFGVQTIIAQNGIQLSSGSTGSVTNNDISALGFTGANTVVGLLVFNGNGLAISDNHYVGTSTSDAGMWLIDSNGSTIQHNTLDTADYGILNTGVMTTEPTVVNQGLNANSYTNIEFTNDDLELIPATQTTAIHPVGSDGADFYTGGAGADVIDGRGGGDYIVGNAGADTLTGGLGTDVVDYSAETGPNAVVVNLSATAYAGIAALHATDTFGATDTLSGIENIAANVTRYGDTIALDGDLDFDWTLTFTGGPEAHWTATGINAHAGETHEFRGVEKIVFQCSGPAFAETVHLVDQNQAGSAYLSIQDAIDHASAGDTILLAAGTYTPTAALNIDKNVTILGANHGKDGTDLTRGAETVIDGTGLARVIDLGDHAINVAINGVSINGDHIFDEGTPDQTLAITDSVFSLTTNAANSFYFGYGGGYDFTFANNAVTATGYNEMFELFEGGSVHLKDNHFTGVAGVYTGDDNNVPLVFNLNKATGEVQGNTFDHVDIGVLVADAAGPLDITGNTFENMHRVGPNTAGGLAAGVVFFSPDPFNGLINVSNNTFTNADAGIRTSSFGAPATTVAGSLITINGNQFTDVGFIGYQPVGGVLHFTNSTLNPGPITVPSEFFGGTSDDMITSTAANDIVHGNDGIDTLVLSGNQSDYTIAFDGTTVTVTDNRVDVHDAIDTADHIGRLDFADHDVFLVGSGSDYTTVQSAVTAAGASDTVLLAAGTYSENVVVDKALTILGANHGVAGYASRGAESIIDGGFRLTASDVTLDGLNIINGRADFGQQRAAVFIDGARANITVENSILNETAAVHSESTQAAILTTYNANTSNLQVLHNVVENWGTAMYLNPGVHDSTFDDNTFADNGNHFIIDGLDDLTITNNDFGASGGSKIFANVYDNPTDLEIELGLSGNTFTPDHPRLSVAPYGAAGQVVLGTSGDDNLRGDFGAAVAQTLDGRAGNDLLVGDAGNDILIGGAGDDILTGGAHDVVNALTGVGGDTANYSSSSVGLNIALTSGGASNVADGLGGLDTLTGIENLIGGSAGDTLTGDGSNNVLIGNGGANILNGLGGDDRLAGGDVHDVLNGGSGNDVLIGGGGSDTLSGGDDADRFVYNLQSDAGTAVNAGEDQIFGFSHAQGDTFAFKSSFFTANENLVLDDGTGHVKADGLLITDVTDTSYSGFTGQPLFVLDTVVGGSAGTLWFDANGNGSLTDTNDVKIATFDNATSLAGINAHDLLLV